MRLTAESVDLTLIQPTRTGLEKSILDATASVRNFLRERGLHDYNGQGLGATENGVNLDAVLLSADTEKTSVASLYRPKAKSGDPRIWFTGLQGFANPDDMIAVTALAGRLLLINITQVDLLNVLDIQRAGPLWEMLRAVSASAQSVANELLAKLRKIAAAGLVPSVMASRADTAVGRTLESALGIAINSKKEPDYKGIELKSYRRAASASRENRKNLFAQVPNWSISKFKSSTEIMNAFGYYRGEQFKLYCEVSTKVHNSQGLYLKIDDGAGILNECSVRPPIGAFASWLLMDLHAILAAKHNETFWVSANVHVVDGHDHFEFKDVIHTRKPIPSQFDILLDQGEITVDHLIKRNAAGRGMEKGPLFKVKAASLPLLFPPSQTYALA